MGNMDSNMRVEKKRRVSADYLERVQKGMDSNVRWALVDWLVAVADQFKFLPDTTYLAVSYMDIFLSEKTIPLKDLPLLGISSLLVASKYEETNHPDNPCVQDFCYVAGNRYTKQQVVKMEMDLLKSLNYELGIPTAMSFLHRFGNYDDPDSQSEFLGCYLGELSLLEYECLKFPPSLVAAAAVFLSKFTLNPELNPWDDQLQLCSGYKAAQLKECVQILHDLQLKARGPSFVAVREKYKQHKFECVSMLLPPSSIPSRYFEEAIDHPFVLNAQKRKRAAPEYVSDDYASASCKKIRFYPQVQAALLA